MTIAAVEHETRLPKESLRIWERRYGFPQPHRERGGERFYPPDQVEKLRLIRRLLDLGFRPGAVVRQSVESLRGLISNSIPPRSSSDAFGDETETILKAIKERDVNRVRDQLRWQLASLGIPKFVIELTARLNEAVGTSWASGRFTAAEEHLYTEQVEWVLRTATAQVPVAPRAPTVLLATLPGEEHKIGLLMLEAVLRNELATCIPLGTQVPRNELVDIAVGSKVDIVALSFSSAYPRKSAVDGLSALRSALPAHIAIWAGGDGLLGIRKPPAGVVAPMTLPSALRELRDWNARAASGATGRPAA